MQEQDSVQILIDSDDMDPVIKEGDLISVIKDKRLEDGCFYLVTLDGKPLIRLYTETPEGCILIPLNLQWHSPLFIPRSDMPDRIRVCGRIELLQRRLYFELDF